MLMDAEERAAIQQPHLMAEAGVGVFVEYRVAAEKAAVPGSADVDVAHRDRDVVEGREGHGLQASPLCGAGPASGRWPSTHRRRPVRRR